MEYMSNQEGLYKKAENVSEWLASAEGKNSMERALEEAKITTDGLRKAREIPRWKLYIPISSPRLI